MSDEEAAVALSSSEAADLAGMLRRLRESHWPDDEVTQGQLAAAIGVTAATISTWESSKSTKSPNAERLRAYARFFATRRSIEGDPRLILDKDLDDGELAELRRLESQLIGALGGDTNERPGIFTFSSGPVTIICPEAPKDVRGALASRNAPNFTKLQQYADLDALIEIHGHVRAMNPSLDVFHRLASEAKPDDLSTHVILLGGVGWNKASRRFLHALEQMPISQINDPDLTGDDEDYGEIFRARDSDEVKTFRPIWEGTDEDRELTEDVALLARIPNPFNGTRTLTICNGVHSRGVLGAVRCLTDAQIRDANEQFLADRYPDGRFALLLRVPVVENETLSPDLQNAETRLFEWSPEDGVPA
ncbi:helix-turn-helix domain-containing protein [Pseudonocardia endophytica]|uniref:Helix-turn-helix protein n=1 Tax=Pseudonocardia endophytica TaxID=401976 RepID=A0A4R1HGR9_PSEEN|nr:helix-turn-helix transcriptional regulator [Pseudonocardia endophytica]TCK21384.1 helix-turn-helix protein [Pseudonocardia endophytica]